MRSFSYVFLAISLLFQMQSGASAIELSDKHKKALKLECKESVRAGEYVTKNQCYLNKTKILEHYGYAWVDIIDDKEHAKIIELKCHIFIDDGVFMYNQCIEQHVNSILGIIREPTPEPPVIIVENPDEPNTGITIDKSDGQSDLIAEQSIIDIDDIYEKTKESVLYLEHCSLSSEQELNEYEDNSDCEGGSGSAVVVSSNLAFTNCHVIYDYTSKKPSLDVMAFDPTKMEEYYEETAIPMHATLYKEIPEKDICIVKLAEWGTNKEVNLNYVKIENINSVKINDIVYTHGHPLGELSVFQPGKITAKKNSPQNWFWEHQAGNSFVEIYEVDAIIEPGNSGGALFNASGKLIGITSAGRSDTLSENKIQHNFAIRIDQYKELLK